MPCTKRGHNKKGSPRRLGKPDLGESRHPTSGEVEYAGLRSRYLISVDPSGSIHILRCEKRRCTHQDDPPVVGDKDH